MMRFSSRISWSLEPSALAEAAAARSDNTLDLTQSNPTDAGLRYVEDRITAALADSRWLRYEPAPAGLRSARDAVSAYYRGAVAPEAILLTASTSEAYSYLFKLLCNPNDEVLVPRPSYPLFEFLAHLECVRPVQYPMHYGGGWYVDLQALDTLVTRRTRAIVFVNPNNPTGSFLSETEYAAMAALCGKHGLALITDEVFADYVLTPVDNSVRTLAGRSDVLNFVLSGLSKVCGLPQLKAGWIAAQGPASREALDRLELIADTFLSVASPVQHALPSLLEMRHDIQCQIAERTRCNLDVLRSLSAESPARVLDVQGGWYATLQVPRVRTEEEWVLHLLREHDTLVQPGYFYDFESEAFLVLSLLTESHVFEEGAKRTILACKG